MIDRYDDNVMLLLWHVCVCMCVRVCVCNCAWQCDYYSMCLWWRWLSDWHITKSRKQRCQYDDLIVKNSPWQLSHGTPKQDHTLYLYSYRLYCRIVLLLRSWTVLLIICVNDLLIERLPLVCLTFGWVVGSFLSWHWYFWTALITDVLYQIFTVF